MSEHNSSIHRRDDDTVARHFNVTGHEVDTFMIIEVGTLLSRRKDIDTKEKLTRDITFRLCILQGLKDGICIVCRASL